MKFGKVSILSPQNCQEGNPGSKKAKQKNWPDPTAHHRSKKDPKTSGRHPLKLIGIKTVGTTVVFLPSMQARSEGSIHTISDRTYLILRREDVA